MPKRLLAKTPVKFLLVFLPLAAVILGVFALIYRLEVQNEINLMMAGQSAIVAAEKVQIEQMLRDGMADVVIQAQNSALVEMPLRPDPALLRYVAMDLSTLLTVTKLYSQARFLNWMGQEVVRVDYRDQKAVVAEDDKLQDKSDRYYFKKAMELDKGQVYLSPLDLNVENGRLERPFNPTLRLASPVVDSAGRKRGVLILNYRGGAIFLEIRKRFAGEGRPLLANRDGWWLMGPEPGDEWGFVLGGREKKNLPAYYPRLWQKVKKQDRGSLLGRRGLFTFDSIAAPGAGMDAPRWHLIFHLPPKAVDDLLGIYLHQLAWLAAFVLAGLAFLVFFLAKAHTARLGFRAMVAENERRLRAILDTAADGVITLDRDRVIRSFNPAAEAIFGYREDEVLGRSISMLYNPSQREAAKEYMERLAAGRQSGLRQTSEAEGLRKDGKVIPISISASLAQLESGPLMIGMVRDITASKKSRQRIARNAENQQVLKELMGLALKSGDLTDSLREALVIIYTTSWLKALPKGGFFLAETTPEGKTLRLVANRNMGPEILKMCDSVPFGRCHCGRAAQTGKIQFSRHVDHLHENAFAGMEDHGHYCVPIVSGAKLLGVLLLYLMPDHQADDDELVFMDSVARTVASLIERRTALKAVAESEARLRAVLDNAVEGIVTIDSRGIVESSNRAMARIFGYSNEELVGNSINLIQPESVRAEHDGYLKKYLRSGESRIIGIGREVEGVKKDGTVIPLYLSVSEVRQGGRITFTGMLRDITELKKYEAALTLAKERAEATSRELMEKQRRLDEDLEAAAGIQQALLPHSLPHLGPVEMDWRFMPSQSIGGDLFNAIPLGENHLAIYMLDVAGHGVPSALLTVSVHEQLDPKNRHVAKFTGGGEIQVTPPAKVMELLDVEYPLERFAKSFTINYMVLDLTTGELVYSSAGHPPPLLVRADGKLERLAEGGTIIGLEGVLPFDQGRVFLRTGDKLLLYTDGVAEYENPRDEFFGSERLEEIFTLHHRDPIGRILDRIWDGLKEFGEGREPSDDVSMLAFEYTGNAPGN